MKSQKERDNLLEKKVESLEDYESLIHVVETQLENASRCNKLRRSLGEVMSNILHFYR